MRKLAEQAVAILDFLQDRCQTLGGTADGDHAIAKDTRAVVTSSVGGVAGENNESMVWLAGQVEESADKTHQALGLLANQVIDEQRTAFANILETVTGLTGGITNAAVAITEAESKTGHLSDLLKKYAEDLRSDSRIS
jgi:hypothetical protein